MSDQIFVETPIKEMGDVITGKTPETAIRDYYGTDYMFVTPNELHSGYIIRHSEKGLSEKGLASIKNNTISGISVLVGCIGWDMGNVALCVDTCATNQQINSITNFKAKYNPYYVYYWLSMKKEYLFQIASVTRTPILNKSTFEEILIPMPELSIQNKVVSVLTAIDNKIQLNNRIIAELEALAKTIYDYWFVQFDFPNAEGKPYRSSGGEMVWNEQLNREIPKGWKQGNLYDIADFINGLACQKYRPKEGEDSLPVIKIKEMREGISKDTETVSANIPDKNKINNGDILFSWSATLEVMYWTDGIGGLNQHIFKIIPKSPYSKEYVYHQLSSYVIRFIKMAEARKTTMGHITTDHLSQSLIVLPNTSTLIQFQKIVKPIHKKILQCSIENHELTKLRDWLLPMLMNGQVTVE
ncbi:restriction endonuclease subunit S [Syntrophomonas curvata]